MFFLESVVLGIAAIIATCAVSFVIGHFIHKATPGNPDSAGTKIVTGSLVLFVLGIASGFCAFVGMFVRFMFGH
jgi:hypothetical protein